MEKRTIPASELVLTNDKRIYHLHLKPGDIGETIFLVGDPGRVELMSALFDEVELRIGNREFVTHTGIFNNKRVSVISTGIGTDNIDIVLNELDALVNIDLETRIIHDELKRLDIIRLGTSGALHAEIEPGSIIVSEVAGGLDNLMYYYESYPEVTDTIISEAFREHMDWNPANSIPYFVHASSRLLSKIQSPSYYSGITLSAPGFYAPQGRSLRSRIYDKAYIEKVTAFRSGPYRINNFEMEGSALYGLSKTLGHHALTVCIALANRVTGKFITDYQSYVRQLLEETLNSVLKDD